MMEVEEDQNWDLVQEAVRRNLVAGEHTMICICLSVSACTHTSTTARTHAHARARTHIYTCMQVRRNLVAGEREVFRRKQELQRQVAEEQRRQAEEQRIRKDVLYKQVYAGAIDESFFSQFGTSAR